MRWPRCVLRQCRQGCSTYADASKEGNRVSALTVSARLAAQVRQVRFRGTLAEARARRLYGHGLYLAESPAVAQTYKDLKPNGACFSNPGFLKALN